MNRQDVIDRLKLTESKLRTAGVAALYLFGSYARDEARADSDIDVFVEPAAESKFGFDAFMDAYEHLQETFPQKEIGYGTHNSIDALIRPSVEADAIRIF